MEKSENRILVLANDFVVGDQVGYNFEYYSCKFGNFSLEVIPITPAIGAIELSIKRIRSMIISSDLIVIQTYGARECISNDGNGYYYEDVIYQAIIQITNSLPVVVMCDSMMDKDFSNIALRSLINGVDMVLFNYDAIIQELWPSYAEAIKSLITMDVDTRRIAQRQRTINAINLEIGRLEKSMARIIREAGESSFLGGALSQYNPDVYDHLPGRIDECRQTVSASVKLLNKMNRQIKYYQSKLEELQDSSQKLLV